MALAGDFINVLVGGYDLTGDSNRIAVADRFDTHDVTTFGDTVHRFILGQRQVAIEHGGYMELAAGRSHPVLKGVGVQGAFSLFIGNNAAPAVGNPVFSLDTLQGRYALAPETAKHIPFIGMYANRGGNGGWGVAVTPPVTINSTPVLGTGIDNGASTSNGAIAYLHVLQAAASDTFQIYVESSDTVGFSSPITSQFTSNGSAVGSERMIILGSVKRFVRFRTVRIGAAGNAIRIAISLIRL